LFSYIFSLFGFVWLLICLIVKFLYAITPCMMHPRALFQSASATLTANFGMLVIVFNCLISTTRLIRACALKSYELFAGFLIDIIYFAGGMVAGGVGGAGGAWLSGGKMPRRNSPRSAALAGSMAGNSRSPAFWMVKMCS
jgi:hypothetical protein